MMVRLRRPGRLVVGLCLLTVAVAGCADSQPAAGRRSETKPPPLDRPAAPAEPNPTNQAAAAAPTPAIDRSEQIRNACLNGRRMICGRIVDIEKSGVVVDSGYSDLLREPLNRSWVVPGNVAATRDPNAIEANVPGTPCIGTVYLNLTDAPKRGAPPIHKNDYILLLAYPAGQYDYVPVAPIKKTIRKFTATLELAVILNMQADGN